MERVKPQVPLIINLRVVATFKLTGTVMQFKHDKVFPSAVTDGSSSPVEQVGIEEKYLIFLYFPKILTAVIINNTQVDETTQRPELFYSFPSSGLIFCDLFFCHHLQYPSKFPILITDIITIQAVLQTHTHLTAVTEFHHLL